MLTQLPFDKGEYALTAFPKGNEFRPDLNILGLLEEIDVGKPDFLQHFRVAQEGFAIDNDILFINHIQGTGPAKDIRRKGLDPQQIFLEFRKKVGINALAVLLTSTLIAAHESGLSSATWKPNPLKNHVLLNHACLLRATGFQPESDGSFQCNLTGNRKEVERRILRRSIGALPEKQYPFWQFYESSRGSLLSLFSSDGLRSGES